MKITLRFQHIYVAAFLLAFAGVPSEGLKAMQGLPKYTSVEVHRVTLSDVQDMFYKTEFDKKIRVAFNNETVEQALKKIAQATGLKLTYRGDIMVNKRITLKKRRISVSDALSFVLEGTGLEYRFSQEGYLLIGRPGEDLKAVVMQEVVTGQVTDASTGETLPGVNIVVKGTTTGTSTNTNGEYELTVESLQDTLIFSFIGYQTQEVPINGRTEVNVALQSQAITGEELVVVGYGTQRQRNVTASISSVNSEELNNKPITNSTQALQGTKGVYVNQMGAQPGRSQAMIRIRGQGTLNNNDPLVLVDGIEYPLENVDPENIENISVLKDAAASAIYGSRAANGVVLVTTKSGKAVEGFQVDYNNYLGAEKVIGLPNFITDPVRFMQLMDQAQRNVGDPPMYGEALINEYKQGMKTDPITYPQNDWFDIMFDPSFLQNHNLRFSGGEEDYSYSLSVGYQKRNGVLMGTNSNKYSISLNANADVTDRLTVAAKISGQFNRFDEPVAGVPYVMNMTFKNAGVGFEPTYLEDGRYADTFILSPGHYVFRNPIALASEGINNHKQQDYVLSLKGEYSFPLNITYEIQGSYTKQDYLNKIFEPAIYQYKVKTEERVRTRITGRPTRHAEKSDINNNQLNLQQILRWNGTVKENHQISTLLGSSFQEFNYNRFWAYREGYLGNQLTTLNAGSTNPDVSGTDSRNSLMSFFGRLDYNLDEKYLFQANLRYDGSSRFAEGNKWGLFPSFSAGWQIAEETFMNNIAWLNTLKLRASWGKLGNERVQSYRYVNLVDVGQDYSFGNNVSSGAAITEYNDPSITWETTTITNMGLDASLLKNKLDLSFEVFNKRTSDILNTVNIPSQVGDLAGPLRNIGTVDNEGFEVSLSYSDMVGPFSYQFSGDFTRIRNEVVDLNGERIINFGSRGRGGTIITEGYPINSYYLIQAIGIFDSQEEIDNHAFQTQDTKPGFIKFKDVNNDGVINQDDRVISDKNRIPSYTYSFNLNLDYKGITLRAHFNGVGDVYTYRARPGDVPFWYGTGVTEKWVNNSWTPENKDAELPILTTYEDATNTNFRNSDFLLRNASYLRLKNLQLSYSLPSIFTDKLKIRSATIFANGQNLLTFTPMDAFDPERDMSTDNAFYDYPSVKTLTGGIEIGF